MAAVGEAPIYLDAYITSRYSTAVHLLVAADSDYVAPLPPLGGQFGLVVGAAAGWQIPVGRHIIDVGPRVAAKAE